MNRIKPWLIPGLLAAVTALSAVLFVSAWRYDNKYTGPRPAARDGVAWLDMDAYGRSPLVHLVDGWEFYQYKLLTPEDIPSHAPDEYLFIGQYGGFELGDAGASPHGEATYRLTVLTDGIPRSYALELPEIYSAYCIWINGELMGRMGGTGPEGYLPRTADSFLTFTASDQIEIVVAVSDWTHFYSGMVYPSAFGSPQAVHRLLSLRLLLHGAACAVAVLIAAFCMLMGLRRQFSMDVFYFILLCLCFAGYAGYTVVHNIGLDGTFWYGLERFSRQGMMICLILLLGSLCGVPRKIYGPAAALGSLACFLALFPHMFYDGTAGSLYIISCLLGGWQWLTALFLVAAGIWGVWRDSVRSVPLLAGGLVFACALVVDRVYPLYEPILGGWHAETAGFVLLLTVAGVLWRDTVRVYRDSLILQEKHRFSQARLDMQLETSRLEREYVDKTHRLRHELRSRFAVMRIYLDKGEYDKADAFAASLLEESNEPSAASYSGNQLLNAILTSKFAGAREQGIDVGWELCGIPAELPIEDRDLGSLVMNILDNAVAACAKVEPPDKRWLKLDIRLAHGLLVVDCKNARAGEILQKDSGFLTTREKKEGHGYGLSIIRDIAGRYDGLADISFSADSFSIRVTLNIQGE